MLENLIGFICEEAAQQRRLTTWHYKLAGSEYLITLKDFYGIVFVPESECETSRRFQDGAAQIPGDASGGRR